MSQIGPVAVPNGRLLMLGLDAASLPFIQDNLARLPTLASLIEKGTLNELECPAGCLSASVWPTFSTGELPGRHGQYFPFQWSGQDGKYRRLADPRWSEEFDSRPFWHRVAEAGIATIAFDVAHTLHDERAPCLQITNWSYQSSGAATASRPGPAQSSVGDSGVAPSAPRFPFRRPRDNAERFGTSSSRQCGRRRMPRFI